jgi:long-chain acyl-CoA synthetase
MIDHAIQTKIWAYMKTGKLDHFYYDALIFRVMRNILGGRIRYMVSGGAPLSVDIKNFLTVIFNSPIFEAYGFTEAAGCVTCTALWDREGGHVGGTLPCNRMQLRDVPEYKIFTDSTPPVGLIYIKGNSIMKGYFKNPEETKKILDKDGWLKVGDVGVLYPNGSIKVLDRLTEMKKL